MKIIRWYENIDLRIKSKIKFSIYELLIMLGCVLAALFMLHRVFYGTEITDEAYYISDALAMIHGNIPYAFNNYSAGTGAAFLIIPFLFIYELVVPNNEGVFLYTRICYMLFWLLTLVLSYRIIKKDIKKSHALLVLGFMIPCVAVNGWGIYNFGYNTIPYALTFLCSLLVYDAIEHKNHYTKVKLFVSGFLLGIVLLAHPGYACAIGVLGIVIIIRSDSIHDKIVNILWCIAGGILELLVVVIPIIVQTGYSALIIGIEHNLHPYPVEPSTSVTASEKLEAVLNIYRAWMPSMLCVFVVVFILSYRYIYEKGQKLSLKNCALLALNCAIFFMTLCYTERLVEKEDVNWSYGLIGAIGMVSLLVFLKFKQHPILLYTGLYPVIFSFVLVVGVDSVVSVGRFRAALPALAIYYLIMLENESELTRLITTVSVIMCILAIGLNSYRDVYRDANYSRLNYKVESGVYKGIYTTEARANDLPELERYLNSIVGDEEYYAFRDNVPAGYLMMHHGIMCDKATWDCMQYTYHRNSPATLYEYYQRRGVIPQKIIYVDYGRDQNLSIEDEDYKYNEFVKAYYEKVDDLPLNSTFYHVVVYEYVGGFDGDFDYWINRHMYTGN